MEFEKLLTVSHKITETKDVFRTQLDIYDGAFFTKIVNG